jgi:hypothetical protein
MYICFHMFQTWKGLDQPSSLASEEEQILLFPHNALIQVPQIEHDGVSEGEVKAPSVEEYVGELLSRIQPAPASEHRRKTVAQYVQEIIAKAFQPAIEASILVPEAKILSGYI